MIDESEFSVSYLDLLATTATRYVSPRDGMDVPHCLCLNVSCSTISYALFGNNTLTAPHNLTIILGPGTHVIDYGGIELHNATYISFIGSESTIVECHNNLTIDDCSLSNILIKNSSFVNFYGITFQNCQSVSSFIHVERSNSVIFDRCTFRNNPRGAFHLYETHSIAFRTCTFVDNVQVPLSDLPHCNQINSNDIFFLDSRATAGAISVYSYKHSLKLLIADSTFIRNSALDDDDDAGLPRALLTFGHGGAIFIRFVESSDSIVCITNSLFVNNTAQTNGGAIQLSAANSSTNNVIHVYDTQFIGNNCTIDTCTGGAIGIDYFKHSNLNFLTFINCSFRDNLASAGGAIALLTSVPTTLEDKERRAIWFNNCTFDHNIARHDGSALSFLSTTSINSLRFPVYIDQCGFLRNVALFSAEQITHSVSTFRIDLYFINETLFYDNFGGGLKLIESQIKLIDQLVLSHNFANDGGGIALYGKCILQLYANSILIFSNNYALNNGGGLYVEYITSDFIFSILNRGCFMQYEDLLEDVPPDQWATNVQFISNTAGIAGAAIYASDMSRCQWFGEDSNATRLIHNTPIFVPIEGYNSPFNFSGNRLARVNSSNITQVALSTNAYNLEVVPEDINVSIYSYMENAKFRLSALDQLNNTREAVWQVDAPLENEPLGAISSNTTSYSYDIPSEEYFMNEASSNDSITLTFSIFSVSSLVQPVILDLPVSTCHPGYMYNNVTGDCQCTNNARQIVRCDKSNRYFYVKEGQWVYTNGSITVFKATIPSYLNCEREQNLPGCLFRFDEPNSQCAQGRTDILCAQCQTNYSLTMDLLTCSNNCNDIAAGVLFIVICEF
jgi:predicted outer membrane repeat protein